MASLSSGTFRELPLQDGQNGPHSTGPVIVNRPLIYQHPGKNNFAVAFRVLVEELKLWDGLQKERIETFRPHDWVRAGVLALRLRYFVEAQTLLEESCKGAEGLAWKILLEIYIMRYDAKGVFTAAGHLFEHYKTTYGISEPHPALIHAVAELVAHHGLKEVNVTLDKMAAAEREASRRELRHYDALKALVDRAYWSRTHGFDR